MRTFVIATLVLTVSRAAFAHIDLESPTARFVQDNNGLKTAPCGSGTPTGVVTPLIAGQTLPVKWKESVSHAGHYRIALSAKESDFVEPKSLDIPTTLPAWDLADGIQDKTGTQEYTQDVKIPNTPCKACVLQLIQVMSFGTDGTNTGSFSGVYHACADVTIAMPDAGAVADAAPDMAGDAAPADAALGTPDVPADLAAMKADAAGGASGTGGALGSGGAGGTGQANAGGVTATGGVSAQGGSNMTGGSSGSSSLGGTKATSSAAGTGGAAGATTSATSGTGGAHQTSSTSNAPTQSTSSGCSVAADGGHSALPTTLLLAALLFAYRMWRRRFGHPRNGAMRSRSWTSSSCATVAIPIKPRPESSRATPRCR